MNGPWLAAIRPVTQIASLPPKPRTARCNLQMPAQLADHDDCPLLAHADVPEMVVGVDQRSAVDHASSPRLSALTPIPLQREIAVDQARADQLSKFYIFVGLVRLLERTGAEHNAPDADVLKVDEIAAAAD